MAAAELRAAVIALYAPSTAPEARTRATGFLAAAVDAPQAWGACLSLLRGGEEAVSTRFWAANALFAKTKRDRGRELPAADRAALARALVEVLGDESSDEVAERHLLDLDLTN